VENRTDREILLEEKAQLNENSRKINDLLKKDAALSKVILSIGSPLVVAAIISLFIMWQNQVKFSAWIESHEEQAEIRIVQIEKNTRVLDTMRSQMSALQNNQNLNVYKLDKIDSTVKEIHIRLDQILRCLLDDECKRIPNGMKGMKGM